MTDNGQPGLNYLCEGYYRFFDHTARYFDYMAREIRANRSPRTVMTERSFEV